MIRKFRLFIRNQQDKMQYNNENHLRKIIRQELMKMYSVNETDLVAPEKSSWEKMKSEFKDLVNELLKHIEDDSYADASSSIERATKILKAWKTKIDKGLMDEADQA